MSWECLEWAGPPSRKGIVRYKHDAAEVALCNKDKGERGAKAVGGLFAGCTVGGIGPDFFGGQVPSEGGVSAILKSGSAKIKSGSAKIEIGTATARTRSCRIIEKIAFAAGNLGV